MACRFAAINGRLDVLEVLAIGNTVLSMEHLRMSAFCCESFGNGNSSFNHDTLQHIFAGVQYSMARHVVEVVATRVPA